MKYGLYKFQDFQHVLKFYSNLIQLTQTETFREMFIKINLHINHLGKVGSYTATSNVNIVEYHNNVTNLVHFHFHNNFIVS
jgi:hypothetical protein